MFTPSFPAECFIITACVLHWHTEGRLFIKVSVGCLHRHTHTHTHTLWEWLSWLCLSCLCCHYVLPDVFYGVNLGICWLMICWIAAVLSVCMSLFALLLMVIQFSCSGSFVTFAACLVLLTYGAFSRCWFCALWWNVSMHGLSITASGRSVGAADFYLHVVIVFRCFLLQTPHLAYSPLTEMTPRSYLDENNLTWSLSHIE